MTFTIKRLLKNREQRSRSLKKRLSEERRKEKRTAENPKKQIPRFKNEKRAGGVNMRKNDKSHFKTYLRQNKTQL